MWLSVRRMKSKLLLSEVEQENERLYEITKHIQHVKSTRDQEYEEFVKQQNEEKDKKEEMVATKIYFRLNANDSKNY